MTRLKIIWAIVAIVLIVAFVWIDPVKAQQQHFFNSGKTSGFIKPFYKSKNIEEIYIVPAKSDNPCPSMPDSWQCPQDPMRSDWVSPEPQKQEKICPSWDFVKKKCRRKK